MLARSPVRNQPSAVNAARLASALPHIAREQRTTAHMEFADFAARQYAILAVGDAQLGTWRSAADRFEADAARIRRPATGSELQFCHSPGLHDPAVRQQILKSFDKVAGTVEPESTAKRKALKSTSANSRCCRHGAIWAGPAIRTVGFAHLSVLINPAGVKRSSKQAVAPTAKPSSSA